MEDKDYVDKDIAYKLYNLGIKIPSNSFYGDRLYTLETIVKEEELSEGDILRPTLYDVQKWLRENNNIFVLVEPYFGEDYNCFISVSIYKLKSNYLEDVTDINIPNFEHYEEALNEGIKEALKLI